MQNLLSTARNRRNFILYLLMMGLSVFLIYLMNIQGEGLQLSHLKSASITLVSPVDYFLGGLLHQLENPFSLLILQIFIILIVARTFGWMVTRIGQPSVSGEIIAGILLGPSLAGALFPSMSSAFFPEHSLPPLQLISQLGLILFMFIIGMELDFNELAKKAREAIMISHTGIALNFVLGVGLAYLLYNEFAPEGTAFISFALFLGISLSITAFPVLARVLQERSLTRTRVGVLALTAAASDDVTAWCLLAAVIAIVKAGSFVSALFTIGLALIYVLFMFKVIKPFMKKIAGVYVTRENINKNVSALVFLVILLSVALTETIGIHALFGAFLAGVIMPSGSEFKKIFTGKIEDLSLVVLLPVFFVVTGLRTKIGLIDSPYLIGLTLFIILIAVTGKIVGTSVAARILGNRWKDSLSIGVLMNTRGLMELIVLNIGYELGILSPEIFTMFVIMALATTFMTGPGLDLINKFFPEAYDTPERSQGLHVMLSFGKPRMGASLFKLSELLFPKAEISALHITPNTEINTNEAADFEKEGFRYLKTESKRSAKPVQYIYKVSSEIKKEILHTVQTEHINFLLTGAAHSVFSENEVGGKIKVLLENIPCEMGVFIKKDFRKKEKVCIVLNESRELQFLKYVPGMLIHPELQVLLAGSLANTEAGLSLAQKSTGRVQIVETSSIDSKIFNSQDLIILGLESWNKYIEILNSTENNNTSILIYHNPKSPEL